MFAIRLPAGVGEVDLPAAQLDPPDLSGDGLGQLVAPGGDNDRGPEGELPLHELTRAALANTPGLSAEVEVFSAELDELTPDLAARRIRTAVDRWREGL